ncbi:MAG: hypothetical protein JNK64_02860 [Myxococcales bacterium]|nr:hypothetical protein [Myxococcales bacterium]
MPGPPRAWALIALASAGACLDIPPYLPCGEADRDCDGWPAMAGAPAARDCDDTNAVVNPAAVDDPATAVIEDCFAEALTTPLAPVTAEARGWSVADVVLEFDSTTRMPSSLRFSNVELLGSNTDPCVRDERAAGISLYPAFGVDDQSVQVGQIATVRGGPALATSRVTWSQAVPMAATGFGCDAATTITGAIDFTVQPNGRVVRSDEVTVSAGVSTCAGCANATGTAPIFTSYWTFAPSFDRYRVQPAPTSSVFPGAGMPAIDLPAPGAPTAGCISGANTSLPRVGVAWSFPTPIAGMRARTTNDGRVNHAMVVDWVNSSAVAAGTHRLVSALAPALGGGGECPDALLRAMEEFTVPPTLTPTDFVATRGVYRYTGDEGAGITITATQGVEGGAVIEVPNASERGLTVWRGTGGSYVRLRRGRDYLLQLDADRTGVIYLPAIVAGTTLVVAGPGGEPPA